MAIIVVPTTTKKRPLNEWQFFLQVDRQPGTRYHFAKCRFCHESYEREKVTNPHVPPPKLILSRKHNMQTHLANCEHILNHSAVLEEIELSSDDDDSGNNVAREQEKYGQGLMIPFTPDTNLSPHRPHAARQPNREFPLPQVPVSTSQPHLSHDATSAIPNHVSANDSQSAPAYPLTSHRVAAIDSRYLNVPVNTVCYCHDTHMASGSTATTTTTSAAATAFEFHHALVVFTIYAGLPMEWIQAASAASTRDDAHTMRCHVSFLSLLFQRPLPSLKDFCGPILRSVQAATEDHVRSVMRTALPSVMCLLPWTLVIHQFSIDNRRSTTSTLTHTAWLVQSTTGAVLPLRLPGTQTLTWSHLSISTGLDQLVMHCRHHQIPLVAVNMPLSHHTRHSFDHHHHHLLIVPHLSFRCLWHDLIHDEAFVKEIESADRVRPLETTQFIDVLAWLSHTTTSIELGPFLALLDRISTATQLTAAQSLYYLGGLYRCCVQHLSKHRRWHALQRALLATLEDLWQTMNQRLFVLAQALHPHLRDQSFWPTRTAAFQWDAIADTACDVYHQLFQRRPDKSFKDHVMAYGLGTEAVFAPAFIADFSSVHDYIAYLRDRPDHSYTALSQLMEHVISIVAVFHWQSDVDYDNVHKNARRYCWASVEDLEVQQQLHYIALCHDIPRVTQARPDVHVMIARWKAELEPRPTLCTREIGHGTRETYRLHELFGPPESLSCEIISKRPRTAVRS